MKRSKVFSSTDEAVADIHAGAVVMVAGYGPPGTPQGLVRALSRTGVGGLTCISGPWYLEEPGLFDVRRLAAGGQVARVITSEPLQAGPYSGHPDSWAQGVPDVHLVPVGVLAERIRAAGAGLGAVLLPKGAGTSVSADVEVQIIDGREYIMEEPLKADYALLRASVADTLGNLVYHRAQRNWNPIMATAADLSIAEVDEIVQQGELDPELVVTPGIYVDRIVVRSEEDDVRQA